MNGARSSFSRCLPAMRGPIFSIQQGLKTPWVARTTTFTGSVPLKTRKKRTTRTRTRTMSTLCLAPHTLLSSHSYVRLLRSDDDDDDDEDGEGKKKKKKNEPHMMDPDHRLLLRSAQSLLSSRNSGVIMAVVQIYECCAPPNELGIIVKPLTRLLRGHREVQNVALITIASLVSQESRRIAFEPFIKTFFIRGDDPGFIRSIKLEILTCLASDATISIILREFQMYIAPHQSSARSVHRSPFPSADSFIVRNQVRDRYRQAVCLSGNPVHRESCCQARARH